MDTPATRSGQHEMLRRRVFTAVIALAVISVVLFVLPPLAARGFIAVLFLAAAWEWSGLLNLVSSATRIVYVAFVAVMLGASATVLADAVALEPLLQVALAWWLVALVWSFFFPTPIPAVAGWVCGILILLPAWLAVDHLYLSNTQMLLFALLIVWVADIGAYFVGKGFGRVKLAPRISPGKTWEGVLGGLCAVLVLASAGSYWFRFDIAVLVPFCLAVALISIVGDLTVSMFKRNAGVKDSGTLFPGHGGILDRIDSVTAALPLFVLAGTWSGLL